MIKTNILEDVTIIRLLLILLLVLYHSFAIYNGAWENPIANTNINLYWWIATFSYAFMLEAFVFISGYVLGFQVLKKGKSIFSFDNLIKKKIKRLILPSFFFSIIYYILFYDFNKPVLEIIYIIINGSGHLWFLPMLFWCFVEIYFIEKINLRPKCLFPIVLLISFFTFLPLPLRINSSLYYFLFFYLGYYISINKDWIDRYIKFKYIFLSLVFFIFLFILFNKWDIKMILIGNSLINKFIIFFYGKITRIIYSFLGVILLYITINFLLKKESIRITPLMFKISNLCFGVYIYQQFILNFLYYDSKLSVWLSPEILPWIGFFSTLSLSLLFSWLTIKTKLGKFLIG